MKIYSEDDRIADAYQDDKLLMDGLNLLAKVVAHDVKAKGFTTNWRNVPEKLMLVVTELSEAMEAYRCLKMVGVLRGPVRDSTGDFEEEIADTFIRLLDLCGALDIDIEKAIQAKLIKNRGRPQKHGRQR